MSKFLLDVINCQQPKHSFLSLGVEWKRQEEGDCFMRSDLWSPCVEILPPAVAVICWLTRWLQHTFLEFWWLWGILHRNKFCNECLWKYANRTLCAHDSSQSYKYKNTPWKRGWFLNYKTKFNAVRVKQPDDMASFLFSSSFSAWIRYGRGLASSLKGKPRWRTPSEERYSA